MRTYMESLVKRIDNVAELSSICRGEWCRALESRVDNLQEELDMLRMTGSSVSSGDLEGLGDKLRKAYLHLAPDVHI